MAKCSFCGKEVTIPKGTATLDGRTICCCDEPYCQEQFDDMVENTDAKKESG
jgi:hypothetical protein